MGWLKYRTKWSAGPGMWEWLFLGPLADKGTAEHEVDEIRRRESDGGEHFRGIDWSFEEDAPAAVIKLELLNAQGEASNAMATAVTLARLYGAAVEREKVERAKEFGARLEEAGKHVMKVTKTALRGARKAVDNEYAASMKAALLFNEEMGRKAKRGRKR